MTQLQTLWWLLLIAHRCTSLLIKESFHTCNSVRISDQQYFRNLLYHSDILIDKSLLIKEVLDDENKILLITAPRCSGKTVNLDMIRTFLQVEVDSKGNQIRLPSTTSYTLFMKGELSANGTTKKLKTLPLISQHSDMVTKYLAKYPVIYVNLYFGGFNALSLISGFLFQISTAFEQYSYVIKRYNRTLDNPNVDNNTKAEIRILMAKYYEIQNRNTSLNYLDVQESIRLLSGILYQYFGKKAVILLDEYIVPLEALDMTETFPEDERKIFLEFYFEFMKTTLKENTYLYKAILTGIMPPTEELHQQVFTHTTEANMLTGIFMEYYGVTQWEMTNLLDTLNISTSIRRDINYWYKGYSVNNRDLILYNVLSIAKVLTEKKGSRYWTGTATMRNFLNNFFQCDSFRDKFRTLLNGNEIVVESNRKYLLWSEYEILVRSAHMILAVTNVLVDKAFVFLYHLGYLTLSENLYTEDKYVQYRFKFPNKEINSVMNETWTKLSKN